MENIRRKAQIIIGVGLICLALYIGFNLQYHRDNSLFWRIILIVIAGFGCLFILGDDGILNLRTAKIETLSYDGVVHAKDKSTHINTYFDSKHYSASSHDQYLVRVRTEYGFFDSYSKDAYLIYKEGDKVRISVETRYDGSGKAFKQETVILGFSTM